LHDFFFVFEIVVQCHWGDAEFGGKAAGGEILVADFGDERYCCIDDVLAVVKKTFSAHDLVLHSG